MESKIRFLPHRQIHKNPEQITGRPTQSALEPSIKLRWIPAHSSVYGNELMDREARSAANGMVSAPGLLPDMLRQPLPLNAEKIKENYALSLWISWKESWSLSPRKDRMAAINPTFPFDKFRALQQDLTRAQSSLLFQIRSTTPH